jgi:isoleucyl-tRNA synthetase
VPAAAAPFAELPDRADLPAIEHEVLARWRERRTFERALEQTAGGPAWVCYPAPTAASGVPGLHHLGARVLADALPRFKTMQGFHVPRRAGWNGHGLLVEVAVEKELGLAGAADIESYGVAAFNARCRESARRHADALARLAARMGYWADGPGAGQTTDPARVEAVWGSLQEIFRRGLLVRDLRVSPYCPRCATPLADHELGPPDTDQAVAGPSVTVRFPLRGLPAGAPAELAGADLLAWTAEPWTLVANTAVAVHPELTYAVARRSGHGDRVVVADDLFARLLGDGWHVTRRLPGAALAGASYEPPLRLVDVPDAHRVITAAFVTTDEGTGLVHIAPAFGADDLAAARASGLPVVNPVQPDGTFAADIPLVGGLPVTAAEHRLVSDLSDRGLLLRSQRAERRRPHCWRCGTALLSYAAPAWLIRTTAIRDRLLAQSAGTNWPPPGAGDGGYGEWLRRSPDWVLSRTRYWGTPLPVWTCPAGHATCVGSLAELSGRAGRDLAGLDPHRPDVDDVVIGCPDCGAPAHRVPEVIDAWYDAAAMPFAPSGAQPGRERADPGGAAAQLACAPADTARSWLYSLMVIGTLAFGRPAFRSAVSLGPSADDQGRTVSRHRGNVQEPTALIETRGADAIRWFFAASGPPGATRTITDGALDEVMRRVLLPYWDTAAFLVRGARAAAGRGDAWAPAGRWPPGTPAVAERPAAVAERPAAERPLVDRWLLSELQVLVRDTTSALEALDTAAAGRLLADFLQDTAHWYVRRSRPRFQDGPLTPDGACAFATLYTAVETLTRLMAPIAPFLTDYLWDVLRGGAPPDSVHLAAWPVPDASLVDDRLGTQMALARRLAGLGRAARADAAVPARQPLARALVAAPGFARLPAGLRAEVCAELNVGGLEPLDSAAAEELVRYVVRPGFPALGRRFGLGARAVAAAISAADPAGLARALHAAGAATVIAGRAAVTLAPGDVIITPVPRPGWSVAAAGGETVALDVAISPGLRREGLARELVGLVEEARRADGLDARDRIGLRWATADPELAAALAEHGGLIAAEVRAADYGPADVAGGPGGREHVAAGLGLTFWLRRIAGA